MAAETGVVTRPRSAWRRVVDEQRDAIILVGILLGIVILAGIFIPEFRTSRNLINVLRQGVALGIVSIGQNLAIMVGGVDLSVGAAGNPGDV